MTTMPRMKFIDGDEELKYLPSHLKQQLQDHIQHTGITDLPSESFWGLMRRPAPSSHKVYSYDGRPVTWRVAAHPSAKLYVARFKYGSESEFYVVKERSSTDISSGEAVFVFPVMGWVVKEFEGISYNCVRFHVWTPLADAGVRRPEAAEVLRGIASSNGIVGSAYSQNESQMKMDAEADESGREDHLAQGGMPQYAGRLRASSQSPEQQRDTDTVDMTSPTRNENPARSNRSFPNIPRRRLCRSSGVPACGKTGSSDDARVLSHSQRGPMRVVEDDTLPRAGEDVASDNSQQETDEDEAGIAREARSRESKPPSCDRQATFPNTRPTASSMNPPSRRRATMKRSETQTNAFSATSRNGSMMSQDLSDNNMTRYPSQQVFGKKNVRIPPASTYTRSFSISSQPQIGPTFIFKQSLDGHVLRSKPRTYCDCIEALFAHATAAGICVRKAWELELVTAHRTSTLAIRGDPEDFEEVCRESGVLGEVVVLPVT